MNIDCGVDLQDVVCGYDVEVIDSETNPPVIDLKFIADVATPELKAKKRIVNALFPFIADISLGELDIFRYERGSHIFDCVETLRGDIDFQGVIDRGAQRERCESTRREKQNR